jgi:hypothetical protein
VKEFYRVLSEELSTKVLGRRCDGRALVAGGERGAVRCERGATVVNNKTGARYTNSTPWHSTSLVCPPAFSTLLRRSPLLVGR